MRSFTNFLLFEDILEAIPDGSPLLTQTVNKLLSPVAEIIEEDCGTLLGEVVDISYELEGRVEVATNLPLSKTRINYLLSEGSYIVRIRTLHSCMSDGGICQKCYESNFIGDTAPEIGSRAPIDSYQVFQSDTIIGNGIKSEFELTQSEDDYDYAVVVKEGVIVTSGYSITGTTITFNSPLSINETYIVHFYSLTSQPFLGYIARTYSGGLLGIRPLPTLDLLLKPIYYQALFNDQILFRMVKEVEYIKEIPRTYIDYIDRIHDPLEKALYITYLYTIYKNIEN